ncbi:ama1 protein, putative [Bodo saltans]|uniref:Ama1 protein, putative n=1 Tax=Bodo saltans TaxID=75058 RepID=A0A0S4INU7_BODSA|nr:ama1 protein, putative [Bodo saltans]|eukprot:CUE71947.1 ama1 protein, putative [Bodo saltans]
MAALFIPDDYNTGLWGCFSDCNSCLDGFFCSYCLVSAEYSMLEYRRPGVDWLLCCGLFLADIATAGIAGLGASIITRSSSNVLFGLKKDSDLTSCLKACCCPACSACQVYREMSIRYLWPGGLCVSQPFQKIGLQAPPQVYMRAPMRHPFYTEQQVPVAQQNPQQPQYQQYSNQQPPPGGYPNYQQQQYGGGYPQQQNAGYNQGYQQQQPNQQQPQPGYQHQEQQQQGYQLGYQSNTNNGYQQLPQQQYQQPKQVE